MKICNLLVAAAMALSSLGVFSASVTKKNYDEISGNDDVVVDVDLSGISGSADTNTVNGLIGEYDRTNLAERIDRKRDKDDFRVYRKMKDCWTWTSNPVEDAPEEAPADFLAYANSPGAPALYCRYGYWYGATQFWPDGRYKYDASTIPPSGGELRTNIQWKISARAPDGTELYRFGALSVRQDPTNETLVSWTDSPVNEYVRIATTDLVDLRARDVASAATNGIRRIDGEARMLPKYLHALSFDSSYPEEAEAYYRRADAPFGGGCSARRVGNVCERNYDWNFDESAEFVVRISAASNRFASIGVCSVGTNLTEEMVTSGKWSPFYKVLPGRTLDGINENGVFCEINVVATNGVADWETETEGRDINSMGAVRWVLDHATDAHMAATSLAARVYISPAMKALGYSAHYAICDKKGTYVVEDGEVMEWDPTVPAVMTNFRLWNYGRSSHDDPYGTGFERFDILCDNTKSITNAWFTGAYSPDLPRLTEFAAPGIGTHTETNALRAYAEAHVVPNLPPKRNGLWWQTVHTSVYDLENRTLRVCVQENPDWYVFSVPSAGGVKPDAVREIALWPATNYTDRATGEIIRIVGTLADEKRDKTDLSVTPQWAFNGLPDGEDVSLGPTWFEDGSYWYIETKNALGWIDRISGKQATVLTFSLSGYYPEEYLSYHPVAVKDRLSKISDIAAAISTNNSAFVSAVRSTPPDPETPWGTYGTLGAAIAGIIAMLANKLTKGLDAQGVPTDPNVAELFSKSDTFETDKHLNNSVLESSILDLVEAHYANADNTSYGSAE